MTTSTLTPHQTFRETVALVAARAKERLPEAVNGRIESAVKLVLAYDVTPQADGTIVVGSSSDPMKTYRLVGTTCECQDFTRGQAPGGFCQHRIAAGIDKRVRELLPPAPEPEPVPDPPPVEPWPDNDPEPVAAPVPPAPALPEARASINVRLTIQGRDCQLTLRDHDEARLLVRLEEVLQRYPLPQPPAQPPSPQPLSPQQHNAAAMHKKVTDFCPVHGVQMKQNQKDGRLWYSHYDEAAGRWCKGK